MECSLAVLIACFSWANVYVDSGLSVQDAGVYQYFDYRSRRVDQGEGVVSETITRTNWGNHSANNPYGRFTVGYELNFGSMSWRLEASHTSSLSTDEDRGINALTLSARWYPFR